MTLTNGEKFFCVEIFHKLKAREDFFPRAMENFNSADFAAAFVGKKIFLWTLGKFSAKKSSARLTKFLTVEPVKAR